MINGKATIDIEIWRVKAPSPQQPQQHQPQQQQPQQQQPQQWATQERAENQAQQQDKALALDASTVLHRGTYQIEFALSEEKSSYETPSPSATLHVFDALFHNIVATFVPDPSTADIWFEFPTPKDLRQPITFVGAHERVLSKFKYLSEWIERERREREEQRRQQLEEEWRIHHHLQWGQEQERGNLAVRGIGQQGPRGSTSVGPRVGHQFEGHADLTAPRSQQRDVPLSSVTESSSSSLHPTRLMTLPRTSLSRGQIHTPRTPLPPPLSASSTPITPIPQVQLRYQQQPLPVLRITVKDMSLEVFQVLLQYLYIGGITLSDSQRVEVEDYWTVNPENYHRLSEEERKTCSQNENERQVEALKECIPVLLPSLNSSNRASEPFFSQQQQQQQGQEPHHDHQPKSFTAPLDSWPDPDPHSLPRPDHHPLSPQVYRHHHRGQPSCSWEDLLLAANKLHLKPLQDLAMRALQYRCQMLAVQASLNNSVLAEVAHNGFGEAKLDFQLALGEEILRSFLSLYSNYKNNNNNNSNQTSKHSDEIEELIGARATAGHEAAPIEHGGDDETEDEDVVVKEISRVSRMTEIPASIHSNVASASVPPPVVLRTSLLQTPLPVELSTLSSPSSGVAREQVRVIQEHLERSIVVCRSEDTSSSSFSRQEAKRQRRGSHYDSAEWVLQAAAAAGPSSNLPSSGQDSDDDTNNKDKSEQTSKNDLLDDPECEHVIMDLCKELRLRILRMRDIMEPSRY
ncbi:hypothetical protein EC968_002911 [Mortierella alpina]|nr:hypothetical protein EC968_002911 [Mortierella alpina]